MNEYQLVRELPSNACMSLVGAATGDPLPDGSVLLWRKDMDRMGLERLRDWLFEMVVRAHVPVAIGTHPDSRLRKATDW